MKRLLYYVKHIRNMWYWNFDKYIVAGLQTLKPLLYKKLRSMTISQNQITMDYSGSRRLFASLIFQSVTQYFLHTLLNYLGQKLFTTYVSNYFAHTQTGIEYFIKHQSASSNKSNKWSESLTNYSLSGSLWYQWHFYHTLDSYLPVFYDIVITCYYL